jgi:WD40 repeat protein/tetratricopeptide (TPR) repeat protein
LSPDGQRIALGYMLDAGLVVYDTTTGRLLAQNGSAHASPIAAIAFSGDGGRLATADSEGTIKVWADPEKLASKSATRLTLKGHQGAITTVGFSSDGKRLVSTSVDKTARVWDLENAGAATRSLERSDRCYVARFSPNGQLIATADGSGLRLWDGATGRLVRELSAGDNSRIYSVAFSPANDRLLAVGYGARELSGQAGISYVALWDIDAGVELARLSGATDLPDFQVNEMTGPVAALVFSPDGKYLVAGFGNKFWFSSASSPNPLMVWEVATRRLIRRLKGHTGFCVSLDFSRDGKLLASGSRDGTAIIWSTATWKATHRLENPDRSDRESQAGRSFVDDVALSPDGKTLALASRGGNVHLWDVATGKLLQKLKGHSSAVSAVAFSPDGRTLASGGNDQTVRLWNVPTGRELMQLDAASVELGSVVTLAFSPDGQHLLAGGRRTAFWSAAPIVWNDPDRAAAKLRLLLQSDADFQGRIRMLSENLRLHEALARLDTKDVRVQAALAATRANWQASRQAWAEAAEAFDRLAAADPTHPAGWLRTPGLLRVATALLQQNRPRDAATLLQGGAKRREQDGVSAAVDRAGIGLMYSSEGGTVRVNELLRASPASRSRLVPGDTIVKVNDTEVNNASIPKLDGMLAGQAGSKLRLTVRHPGSEKSERIELTRQRFVNDAATGELLHPLRTAINERLAKEPRNAGLLELRAELAGQWSDAKAQVADYTAAIDALSLLPALPPRVGERSRGTKATAGDLKRLYGRRGNAYVTLKRWRQAVDDYDRAVTDATTDDALASNQALAEAELLLSSETSKRWTVLKPALAKSELGATLSILPDESILAGRTNPLTDRYRVVLTVPKDIDLAAVRLEALTHPSLPGNGPGRYPGRNGDQFTGTFAQSSWNVTAALPHRRDSIKLEFDQAWADYQLIGTQITTNGAWNIAGYQGKNATAIWSMAKPVSLTKGTKLTFDMQSAKGSEGHENLGHFRLSMSSDPAAIEREQEHAALTDPWQKLAAAYQLKGDQRAIDQLVKRRPKLASPVGDLFTEGPNQHWQRGLAIYNKGLAAQASNVDLLSKRARAYEALKKWDAAAADWSRAASGNPDGAKLLAEFAIRLGAANQVALAKAQFERSQALYEQALKGDPGSDVVAAELAQMLFDKSALDKSRSADPDWVVLKPAETQTESGAKLTLQDDGSNLVQSAPSTEPQTVRWQPGPQPVRAVRIETGTHTVPPISGAPFFNEEYQALAAGMAGRGQYVRLDLPGDNSAFPRHTRADADGAVHKDKKIINLAEVQVFQADRNIALRKKARQSSTWADNRTGPERAVDGNTVGNDQGNPYAHTRWEDNPWWEVDLGSEQAIDRIVVWNRSDLNLYARMNHFRIRVLDRSRKVVFAQVVAKAPSPSIEVVPQALLVQTEPQAVGDKQPLILRLPRGARKDAPPRYRVSVATRLADLGVEDIRYQAMKVTDVEACLAAGYAVNGRNAEALSRFRTALRQADVYEASKPIVELAARFDEVLSALAEQRPSDTRLQLALARTLAERGKQRLADRQPAKAQAELETSHEALTRLRQGPTWDVLTPTELKSQGGETLTVERDGSIFVSGPNPNRAVYTLKLRTDLPTLTAIRLETIPDARLPQGGAGRYGNGNFHVAELTAAVVSGQAHARPISIEFGSATADVSQDPQAYGPAKSIDGDPRTWWDTLNPGGVQEAHWAVFVLKSPARTDGGSLIITLDSGITQWGYHGLGRFRLSATNAADLGRALVRNDLKDSEVVDLCIALAKAHAQQGHVNEAVASFTEALELATGPAAKAKIITEAAPLKGLLDKLAEHAAGDTQFQAELARHFAARGNAPLAEAARAKARTLFEAKLAKEPKNSAWAAGLAEVLLIDSGAKTSAGGAARPERFVRLGRHNDANGIEPVDYATDGVTEPAEIEGQPCRLVQTGSRGWGHAYFAIEKGFKWAPTMNVQVEIDYWADSSGTFQIQYDAHDDSYNRSQAPVQLDGSRGWQTAQFAITGARFANSQNGRADFRILVTSAGRFYLKRVAVRRLSAREQKSSAAMKLTDPWAKLAAAYHVIGDEQALDRLLAHHPAAAAGIGDLYASAGRTREAVPYLAKASAANPKDTILSLQVAALQAWFGQEKELAASRQRIRAFAKDTKEAVTAERAAKACTILPCGTDLKSVLRDQAELEAALALARAGMKLGKVGELNEWNLLAFGMAEYRCGHDAAAEEALRAPPRPARTTPRSRAQRHSTGQWAYSDKARKTKA